MDDFFYPLSKQAREARCGKSSVIAGPKNKEQQWSTRITPLTLSLDCDCC